jgi:hypothetical protein
MRHIRDVIATGFPENVIPVGVTKIGGFGFIVPVDASIPEGLHNPGGIVRTAIAHDKQFKVSVGLSKYGFDGKRQYIRSIVCGQKNTHQGTASDPASYDGIDRVSHDVWRVSGITCMPIGTNMVFYPYSAAAGIYPAVHDYRGGWAY